MWGPSKLKHLAKPKSSLSQSLNRDRTNLLGKERNTYTLQFTWTTEMLGCSRTGPKSSPTCFGLDLDLKFYYTGRARVSYLGPFNKTGHPWIGPCTRDFIIMLTRDGLGLTVRPEMGLVQARAKCSELGLGLDIGRPMNTLKCTSVLRTCLNFICMEIWNSGTFYHTHSDLN